VGSPHELYEDPQDPFVAEFIGETNLLSGTMLASGRVGLDNGTAELIVTGDARPGTRVRVSIRPERVVLSTAGGNVDGWNRVWGRVEEIVYVGEATKYRIRLEGGHLMRAKQLNGRTTPAYDIGTHVALLWHVTDGRLLATAEPHLGE
jgi:ABC-type Fe3+/spermidine/putrescine transport system ATPase subunit